MTFDEFLEALPELTRELTSEEKDHLKQLLNTSALRTALALIMLERSKIATRLVTMDFQKKTVENIGLDLAKLQGEALGYHKAIGLLFELVESEEEEEPPAEEETDNGS